MVMNYTSQDVYNAIYTGAKDSGACERESNYWAGVAQRMLKKYKYLDVQPLIDKAISRALVASEVNCK